MPETFSKWIAASGAPVSQQFAALHPVVKFANIMSQAQQAMSPSPAFQPPNPINQGSMVQSPKSGYNPANR